VLYLTLAVDSIAPMVRMRQIKGAAGGGQSLAIPTALTIRQRRRQAMKWILDTASKKRHRISGKGTFAFRVAEEIIAVVEGRSALWERRGNLHKQAVAARSNIKARRRLKRKAV
jgi:small subunit ribosomal protein S7